ncbi:hypothetical protein BH11ARM2_BH11ARM2_00640 [soil metagenome]
MPHLESRYQYQEIAKELKRGIQRGDFHESGRLPSERTLGERFGVQRNTVRQALALLEKEGQIVIEGKRGSFVRLEPVATARKTFMVHIHGGVTPTLGGLMDGLGQTARRAGYATRQWDTHPAHGAALDPVLQVDSIPEDAAGLILWPQNPTDAEALTNLNHALPVVLVDRRVIGVSADCVRFDDVTGGKLVTDHLLEQGHRRIGFLTDDVFAETVQHRWQGYAAALEAATVPIDPGWSLFFQGIHEPYFSVAMRHLLGRDGESPTAIVCSNDLVAFMLFRFLRDEGIRVPDQLAVTGYGNAMPSYVEAMALTSVDQPFYDLGRTAANLLIERAGQGANERLRSPKDITIPVRLVVRKSSLGASTHL